MVAATDPGSPCYVVKGAWIRDALRQAASCRMARSLRLEQDANAFFALLPLLQHGAVDAVGAPAPDPSLATRLRRAFASTAVKCFVADARELTNDSHVAIRNGDVYLRTENPLTAGFTPPCAGHVAEMLGTALRFHATALAANRGDGGKVAACAVIGMQVLLTIHPFRDGNGRTARMFLAAQLLRHLGPVAAVLLGMLLMHRSGAHQYHQASWALRAGDPEPMVGLFVESELLAHDCLQRAPKDSSAAALLEHCWMEVRALR